MLVYNLILWVLVHESLADVNRITRLACSQFNFCVDIMVSVEKFEDGYKIGDVILFGVSENHQGMLNCKKSIGPMMNYEKSDHAMIEYPGDYDMMNVQVHAVVAKDDTLHYAIQHGSKKIVIINHKSALKNLDTNHVDVWVFENPKLAEVFEKLEYEGEKINVADL